MQPGCKQPSTASNKQEITFSTFSFAVSKTFTIFAGNMEREPVFKYLKQIDELLALGCQLPELFYEYEGCDLNKSFQITKNLIAKDYEKG